jgi:hypothetical protein
MRCCRHWEHSTATRNRVRSSDADLNVVLCTAMLRAALACALPCTSREQDAPALVQLMMAGGTPIPETQGIWRSRGYGWILDAHDRGIAVYHVSKAGCSRDPRTAEFVAQFAFRRASAPANQLHLMQYPGENVYVFDRLPMLCLESASRLIGHPAGCSSMLPPVIGKTTHSSVSAALTGKRASEGTGRSSPG